MDSIKYRAFVKTAEYGSMTKAARALGYSQPGISHMIDDLEKEAGFPLLNRSRKAITLTEVGEKVLFYCYQIIQNEDALQQTLTAINGKMEGCLRISAVNSMMVHFLPGLVKEYSEIYPNIRVEIFENSYQDTPEILKSGKIDICLMSDNVPKGYHFHELFEDKIMVLMPSNHPLAENDKIELSQLNGFNMIMPKEPWCEVTRQIIEGKTVFPNAKHATTSDVAAMALCKNNQGLYITSELHLQMMPEGLVAKEFKEKYSRKMGLIYKSMASATPSTREFIKMADAFCKKNRVNQL